ncbi:uncharacterized protein EI90DRAFT_3013279 [Cantharellus anzutake]|uniref:uncharacterized protein n=1 Tax=Cantharellus anzutake TaxID=1750568 RepID=UPI001907FBA1|nr:uncharacterized protein EI90DRAFT_3013279 [Cantharellus anzutake]KAF8337909.1 hypothetical protein EI90DRAFT_3013279 [Cantharellus anzutake]
MEEADEDVNRKIVSAALQHENFCFAEYDTEMIQCALKEWETGRHLMMEFSGSSFFNIYQSHLDWIIQWSERRPKEWLNISSSLGNAAFKYIVDTKAELPEVCTGEGRWFGYLETTISYISCI